MTDIPGCRARSLVRRSLRGPPDGPVGTCIQLAKAQVSAPTYDEIVIQELREYSTVPGRMPDLLKRFHDHTFALFATHGFTVTFFGLTGPDELVYALEFASVDEMHARWEAFRRDPAWVAAKAASEERGKIVADIRSRVVEPVT